MSYDLATIVGLIAGTLTTTAYIPQVVQTWKTRSTRDLSLGMFVAVNAGIALWFLYGLLIGSPPVIAANGITLVLTAIMLFLKIRHG